AQPVLPLYPGTHGKFSRCPESLVRPMAPRTTSLHTNSDVQTPSPTSFSFI
uniref:Uncharacterized protein n=1 Tax=Trichobilharzia regenti TaxID=157069 RepID=A0AA85JHJ2_TRIRE